jgi:hypothetical protein
MVKIIGKRSGKVYVEGNKADCFRELQKKYPYKKSKKKVYPEPLLVVRV